MSTNRPNRNRQPTAPIGAGDRPSWGEGWGIGLHVWIERAGQSILGPGRLELLESIDRHHSVGAAARMIGMSYRRAWELVQSINEGAGEPLVTAETGGVHGGGAQLDASGPLGHRRLPRYARAASPESRQASSPACESNGTFGSACRGGREPGRGDRAASERFRSASAERSRPRCLRRIGRVGGPSAGRCAGRPFSDGGSSPTRPTSGGEPPPARTAGVPGREWTSRDRPCRWRSGRPPACRPCPRGLPRCSGRSRLSSRSLHPHLSGKPPSSTNRSGGIPSGWRTRGRRSRLSSPARRMRQSCIPAMPSVPRDAGRCFACVGFRFPSFIAARFSTAKTNR